MDMQPGAAWIAEAYDAWLQAMDEASGFSPGIKSAGVTHVILLGLAQHGKTTLALRLLEAIAPDAIGDALRGGRLQGQSATPGPIGYFASQAGASLDGHAITREVEGIFDAYASSFNAVRHGEGQGKALFSALPEIPIPSRNPASPFKVVDMAGFDGRETWAEMAAGYWTARADYTILVIQAEKISQLTGEDFKPVLAQFKNRWTHSDSMLVVTTGSFEQKPDPAEEGLDWEAISKHRGDLFHRDVLGDSAIARDKIELFPMSLLPCDGQADDPLTQESLARLKARLSEDSLLRRLTNAKVLRRDRLASLKSQRTRLEVDANRHGTRLWELEAADRGARDAAEACAKVIRELEEIKSIHKDVEAVVKETRHDVYKIQEPINAFQFHSGRLGEYQDALKGYLKKLHDKFNFVPLDELVACLQSGIHATTLPTSLGEPIAEGFKKEMWVWPFTHYDEEESGKALHYAMKVRESAMLGEVARCASLFHDRVVAGVEHFEDLLKAFRQTKEEELTRCRAEIAGVKAAMADLDRRQADLPPIPDLEVGLQATFTRAWNGLVARANLTDMDENALAWLFLEQWAMKEKLDQVEARFGSTRD